MEMTMFEFFCWALGGGFVLGMLHGLIKPFWAIFKWRVLGFRPHILDKDLIERTTDFAAKRALQTSIDEALKEGYEPSKEQQDAHFAQLKTFGRNIIELYIFKFSNK
jgi:hypothetical protein